MPLKHILFSLACDSECKKPEYNTKSNHFNFCSADNVHMVPAMSPTYKHYNMSFKTKELGHFS